MNLFNYEMIVEALLFVSGEPVSLDKIADTINLDIESTRSLLKEMIIHYKENKRGVIIIEVEDSFQMCTNPSYFTYVEKHYKTNKAQTLTQTLMETLAIIAYKQPVTKSKIEEIRGVSSDHSVNKLIEYGLIGELGRLQGPGRPILFGTTDEFLKYFGYKSIHELPTLNEDFEMLRNEAYMEVNNIL